MAFTRRVAIIGAGASGLTAIKSCKEEGMAAVCYEQTETFGGRWCYKNSHVYGVASVMKSTVAIHSKEMNAFSDFPPPAGFPSYLHHSKMLEYLRLYAETFDLFRHIKYQHKVVYLSTRSGAWILPKVGPRGFPFDMALLRRHVNIMKKHFENTVNHYVENYLEKKFQHGVYQLKPEYRVLEKCSVTNDILPDKILTGRVCIKGSINEINETSVVFEGDDYPTEANVIIFATGYELKIPVLDDHLYTNTDGMSNLYHGVIPSCLNHPTLAIIGFVETQGPSIPVAENQTRWAARVFNKKTFMDTKNSKISPIVVKDYIEYMDSLAQEYNAKPDFSALFFKDPYLYWKCMTGPCLSYQYRIVGPHAWEGSRKAIFEAYERVEAALSMSSCDNSRYTNNNNISEMQECE